MKKLFAMLALAIFSLAVVSCNDKKEDKPAHILSADKTTVVPGDVIVFSLTGDLSGVNWGMCDFKSCFPLKFVDGKFSYTVPADAPVGTYDYYAYDLKDSAHPTNKVKITINALPQ